MSGLKGVLVYRCDECINGARKKGVVYGYVSEAREFGCKHKLRKQKQFETENKVWWEDI